MLVESFNANKIETQSFSEPQGFTNDFATKYDDFIVLLTN